MIPEENRPLVDRVARALLNARGARRGVPAIVNVEDLVGAAIWEAARDDAICALEALWRPISDAPNDGSAFLAYGRHADGNGLHWASGDHFWAILPFAGRLARNLARLEGSPPWPDLTHFFELFPPSLGDVDHAVIYRGLKK